MVRHWGVLRFLLARMKRKRGAGGTEEGVCLTMKRLGESLGRQMKNILVGPILDSAFFLEGDTGCLSAP